MPKKNERCYPSQPRYRRSSFFLKARGLKLRLGDQTKIMGILNITPDSFSGDGLLGRKPDPARNLAIAHKMIQEGADILDIGGESTRPGSSRISVEEEMHRIIPTIKKVAAKTNIPVSVDTYKTTVARAALDAGAKIVNNIMGTALDRDLLKMTKSYDAAVVLMHIRGTPETMQKNIRYRNLIGEILAELQKSIEKCLEIGIKSDRIIIDPGIGFGKTLNHNLQIINRLPDFGHLNKPVLIGTSRKSFIGQVLDRKTPDRLTGTIATICAAILGGAHIVRVHDVQEAKEAAQMTDAIMNASL